jgi:acyl-[acyl-carrier-protein]-phospholipid O-acyltransferase/long-chain-fatty-acid--[acyl-carrier-protein] ligase
VLLTTQKQATVAELTAVAEGVAAIVIPKKIRVVEAIPVMATGKVDYPAVTELAKALP